MPYLRIFNVANMSFNAIHENKINAKILDFTEDAFCNLLLMSGNKYFKHFSNLPASN